MWGQLEDWLLRVAPPTLHLWHFGETESRVSDRPSPGQGKGKTGPSYKEQCEESWEERARGRGGGELLEGDTRRSGRGQMKQRLEMGQGSADGGLGYLSLSLSICLSVPSSVPISYSVRLCGSVSLHLSVPVSVFLQLSQSLPFRKSLSLSTFVSISLHLSLSLICIFPCLSISVSL